MNSWAAVEIVLRTTGGRRRMLVFGGPSFVPGWLLGRQRVHLTHRTLNGVATRTKPPSGLGIDGGAIASSKESDRYDNGTDITIKGRASTMVSMKLNCAQNVHDASEPRV
jgi:hypothetical protein